MGRRSIVVTGGFGSLGSAVARSFVDAGERVARIDSAPVGRDLTAECLDLGGVDLTDEAAAGKAVATVEDRHGGIDVLVNVAGGFVWETLETGSLGAWRRMFDTNILSNATITKAALPVLRRSTAGSIVNIGAGAAVQADAGMGAYAASKSGVHRLTEALARELVGTTVTVNAILPSIIDTPANRSDMPEADASQWVQPQSIAEVVLFLASHRARAISGALIPVTRGGD